MIEDHNVLGSDIDIPNFESERIDEAYDELMEGSDKGIASFSIPTESHLMKGGKTSWGYGKLHNEFDNPSGNFQGSFESNRESKPSTGNFTERVFSIQSVPNYLQEKSLPKQIPEELKSEYSVRKEEESLDPNKCSLQSNELEEKPIKRSKQERNRESAKKCRQRKKEYLTKLENELQATKEELAICKHELETLRGNPLSKVEFEHEKMKAEILGQAKTTMESGILSTKLDELLNTLIVSCFVNRRLQPKS